MEEGIYVRYQTRRKLVVSQLPFADMIAGREGVWRGEIGGRSCLRRQSSTIICVYRVDQFLEPCNPIVLLVLDVIIIIVNVIIIIILVVIIVMVDFVVVGVVVVFLLVVIIVVVIGIILFVFIFVVVVILVITVMAFSICRHRRGCRSSSSASLSA